jgi:hypothetical protein
MLGKCRRARGILWDNNRDEQVVLVIFEVRKLSTGRFLWARLGAAILGLLG